MSAALTGLGALLSHWRRHRMQLAMLLLGLSLATALWSGVQAINAEARASYDRAANALGADALDRLVRADGGEIALSDYAALRRAGIGVSPVVEGRLPSGVRLIGIDPLTLPAQARQVEVGGDDLTAFVAGDLVFAAPDTAPRLEGLTVREAPDLPPGVALADISTAQRLLGIAGVTGLTLPPGVTVPEAVLVRMAPSLLQEGPAPVEDLGRLTDSFHLNLTAFGLLAFAVGLFIVHSAIGLAFEQRRGVFRTLRALGLSAAGLTGLVLAELLVLALVAGVAGVALGYVVAALLLPDVAATLRGLYGAEVAGTLQLRPSWWAAGIGIAVLGTLVAAAQSLWRLWHLPVLAPAQSRAWAQAGVRALRWQAGVAVGFLALALILGLAGRGLAAGFGVLGGLLLGAALLLPVVLVALTGLAAKGARGVLAQWFWADTRAQVPGLSLALMALLLALAANIGVGTMVSSFRLTFTGWLDQRLASEVYIAGRTEEEARALAEWAIPRSDAVLPIWSAETPLAGLPGDAYGVADHATYRDNWPLLEAAPDVWDAVAAGTSILVNEQLSRREGLGVGDSLDLPGGAMTIAGVYSDYGNPRPQILISMAELEARFTDVARLRYGVRIAPDRVEAFAAEMTAAFDLPEGAVIDQASIKRFSLEVFEQTFAVTAALNVLTLGVAGLAMFASLMTLSTMRLPQLAPVWAMGLTRGRLAALDFARTLVLAALVMVAAVPLGLALAWVLLAVVNVAAFGWRLPMHVFPGDWLRLGVLALLAAGLAAAIPVRRLARLQPGDLVRVFANER